MQLLQYVELEFVLEIQKLLIFDSKQINESLMSKNIHIHTSL